MVIKIISLLIYYIVLAIGYYFIVKRLKFLNDKHIKSIDIEGIRINYIKLVRNVFIMFIILAIFVTILVLTFF